MRISALQKRFGDHLEVGAVRALAACRVYPSAHVIANPLTRPFARRLIESEWESKRALIDFPYEITPETIAGVRCARYRTPESRGDGPLALFLHGGAFVCGSAAANAAAILPLCARAGIEAIGVDYTLAPEATFPTQNDEIERVYLALKAEAPGRAIFFVGESAGGALALTATQRLKEKSLPAPAGLILFSPLTDCTGASDSHWSLRARDPIFGDGALEGLKVTMKLYAPGLDARAPELSPVYASFLGAPPILVHVGAREVLLGDSARLCAAVRRDGAESLLRVHDGMFHLFHMHWPLSETRAAFDDAAAFIDRVSRRALAA